MSIIGYFEAGVKRYLSLNKYTKKIKNEMKEIINQFEISLSNNELGDDIFRIKLLKENISKIRRGL